MPEFHSIQVFTVSRCQKVGFLQHVSQSVIFDDFEKPVLWRGAALVRACGCGALLVDKKGWICSPSPQIYLSF